MAYSDEDCIAISGLQHLAFCPRQWGLIHLDQEWEENRLTAEGKTLHERVDEGYREFRQGLRQYSGLHVRCREHGLYGRLDVLEALKSEGENVDIPLLGLTGSWSLQPVEFKRGQPKKHDADIVQLCAQTLCLEEMTGTQIRRGSIFYGEIRRRVDVEITESLRMRTIELAMTAHALLRSGRLPDVDFQAHCKSCSLVSRCMPRTGQSQRIVNYQKELLG
jgi:CRISPR-associated exonuclease Cas4